MSGVGTKTPTGRGRPWVLSLSVIHCQVPSRVKDPVSMSYLVLRGIKNAFVFEGETKPETSHLSFSKCGVIERSVSCITELMSNRDSDSNLEEAASVCRPHCTRAMHGASIAWLLSLELSSLVTLGEFLNLTAPPFSCLGM